LKVNAKAREGRARGGWLWGFAGMFVSREPDGGLIAMPDSFNMVHRRTIIALVDRYRLPAMYYFPFFARDGGLISYGPDEADMFRQAAGYVDRILKGAKASDLPVHQPTKYPALCCTAYVSLWHKGAHLFIARKVRLLWSCGLLIAEAHPHSPQQ
jgi:ABC transporter substrate binding protein